MTDEKTKLSFRETMGLLVYGFKITNRMTPSAYPLMLLQALVTAAQPLIALFFSARVLDELTGGRDARAIVTLTSAAVGLTFILSVAKALLTREYMTIADWEKTYFSILAMEAERYTQIDYAHAEDSAVSEILARMDTQARGNGLGLLNVFSFSSTVVENFFALAFSVILLAGGLYSAGGISGWPAALLLAVFIAGMAITLRYRVMEKNMLERVFTENAKANTVAGYYFNYYKSDQAAKDIRIYDQTDTLINIFRDSFNVKSWISFFFFGGRLNGFSAAMLSIIGGGFYLLTGYKALTGAAAAGSAPAIGAAAASGAVMAGTIVQTVGAAMALATAIGTLISISGQMYNNAAFIKPMREYMTLPDIIVKGDKPVPSAVNGGQELRFEFRGVSFRYPGSEAYALKDLNLTFTPGSRMAVVGPNGSGKTTMIKLLCRLYDPTEGEILLNGVNVKEYDYAQYIALFSVVFQDFTLLPLKVGQNVAAGDAYDAESVTACLGGAGFAERLASMPDGLDTILYKNYDESGTQISGGEAQKIALARALYRNAPMVVLDEPTAALDPIAEYGVYTAFDKTIGGKSAVFISHRLSSCRFCDEIAVFDGGRLVQRGGHEALLADGCGLYYELWNAQAQHYVSDNPAG